MYHRRRREDHPRRDDRTHYADGIDGPAPILGGRARTSIDMLLAARRYRRWISSCGEAFGHRSFPPRAPPSTPSSRRCCIGCDVESIEALNDDLQRAVHGIGRNGPTLYALSGIDIALWDIAGKVGPTSALPPARRAPTLRSPRLREPPALRRCGRRASLDGAGAVPRLSSPQAPRDLGRGGRGGARGRGRRCADHARRELPVDGGGGDRDGAPVGAARPALARRAGVAARGSRRPRRGAGQGRHPDRRRRELRHRVGVPSRVRGASRSRSRSRA